jgi:hypothetical protein
MRQGVERSWWWRSFLVVLVAGAVWLGLPVGAQTQRARRVNPENKTDPNPTAPAQKPDTPAQDPPGGKKATPPEESSESIKISSNLVAVPVSVTDAGGEPVQGLKAPDFQLEEGGQTQSVQMMGLPGQTPLDLALLFDISGSVNERFQFEHGLPCDSCAPSSSRRIRFRSSPSG